MDHQWYWRTEGEEYGPLSTGELEDLVRRNRLKEADRIRLDGSADWLPAERVKVMFGAAGGADGPETGAQSAARVLAGLDRRQLEREADEVSWGTRFAGLVGKGASGPAAVLALCRDWVAAGLAQLLKLFGRKATLGVVAVLLLAVVYRGVDFVDTRTDDARENLASAWEDFQTLKKQGASPAEWKEFERQMTEWLDPAMEELGDSAVRNESASRLWGSSHFDKALGQRNLVSAGWILRDLVAKEQEPQPDTQAKANVVKDINGKPVPPLGVTLARDSQETLFSKRINMAEAYLTGKFRTSRAGAGTNAAKTPVDPLIAGIIVADVGLALGAIAYWWRRRRRRV